MENTTQLIVERFESLAGSDMVEFRQFLKRLRKQFPEQAAEACLMYLASHGVDPAAQSMAFWFGGDTSYIGVLLDEGGLATEMALKAVVAVKDLDPGFLAKFTKAVTEMQAGTAILRALSLLPAVGDYSILIPWLRKLGQHPDLRVRSRTAKVLCELRPNKGLVERQMTSEDARVRASAVEALVGRAQNPADAREVFQAALKDRHHRVVGNAMVGLYLMGETAVLDEMIELSAHKDHLFRAAMAWAMGFVKDLRAIPTLRELTTDASLVVRKRALHSLLILEALQTKQREQDAPLPILELDTKAVEQKQPEEEVPVEKLAAIEFFVFG